LDLICHENLQSLSPEPAAMGELPLTFQKNSLRGDVIFSKAWRVAMSQNHLLADSEDGRVDVATRTYTSTNNTIMDRAVE
jgi:hypothetical protein